MAELLKMVLRGLSCHKTATVTGYQETSAFLRCDLRPDHPGPLHYDATDRIWWSADPETGSG